MLSAGDLAGEFRDQRGKGLSRAIRSSILRQAWRTVE